ncbi:hypothetical protein [Halorubrum sp. C191]|uniref:hypothetical protein n=1 Tax=Halorubrum sp. C191 TaxID=1383842 RepID=UPI001181A85A|nr:hypothetical protein [Halorubrum sp. C191]
MSKIEPEECPRCGAPLNGTVCQTCNWNPRSAATVDCFECGREVYRAQTNEVKVRTAMGVPTTKPVCTDCRPDPAELLGGDR